MAEVGFKSAATYYIAGRELAVALDAGLDHDQAVARMRERLAEHGARITDEQVAYIQRTGRRGGARA